MIDFLARIKSYLNEGRYMGYMGYMTFGQQTAQHLRFLQKAGLELASLTIDSPEFVRARANGKQGRGEYAYKTVSRRLDNGMIGLLTWCRSEGGQITSYKTYGLPPTEDSSRRDASSGAPRNANQHAAEEKTGLDLEKIRKFWEFSSEYGTSDYLRRKGVGAHSIRFRENQYGRVGVVPMRDVHGVLKGYQILNSNGSKVFAKGMKRMGLFHQLTRPSNGQPIGVAEGYVTAATCLELIGISMVAAFTSDNLGQVTAILQGQYPNSPVVIFADNDRHLSENKGAISANEAFVRIGRKGVILTPSFDGYPATHDYTDWNDLVRETGPKNALEQMLKGLNQSQDERILEWLNKSIES
jgi:phage/plasmid primase-like uncharacterized protein